MKRKETMIRNLLVSCIIMFSLFICRSTALATPVQFSNGHYYDAISGSYNWEDARVIAESLSYNGLTGHLATLTSQDENDFVWNAFNMPNRYLLGASDHETEGVWAWVTGETWDFEFWGGGEPNNGLEWNDTCWCWEKMWYDEHALSFDNVATDGSWNDLPYDLAGLDAGTVSGYIVEYDRPIPESTPVPEPSTVMLLGSGLIGVGFLRKRFKK